MDISVALSSISTALGIAKTLNEIEKDFDKSLFKLQVADLRSALADAKIALADLQEDMAAKDREIDALRNSFDLKATLVKDEGYDFFPDADGAPSGFAVCPRCLAVDGRIIQLVRSAGGTSSSNCPQCQSAFDLHSTVRWKSAGQ